MKLSQRLRYISSQVPFLANVIDVATDHSYVAIKLAKQNPQRRVIASDIAEQPLATGKKNAEKHQLTNIEFRLGDGLSVITAQDEIDTAIISGIGGTLMRELLDNAMFELKRYILQPNNKAALVRAWLEEHNYELVADERINEQSQIYETFVAEKKAESSTCYAENKEAFVAECYFGPNIPRIYQTDYNVWIKAKIKQLSKQKAEMSKSTNSHVHQTIIKYDKLIAYGTTRLAQLQESKER